MSHFCVLVVTESKPTEDMLSDVLAPYHEFECTGINDKYVQTIDRTEELLACYEKDKNEGESLMDYLKEEYNYEVCKEGEELDFEGDHKYGYILTNYKNVVVGVFKRTNPNAKWDWWQVGGRFSEYLIGKPHVFELARADEHLVPSIGNPGIMGSKSQNDGFDVIRKGDVDFAAMREAGKTSGLALYDRIYAIVGTLDGFITWEQMREDLDHTNPGKTVDAIRDAYHAQPARMAIKEALKDKNRDNSGLYFIELEEFMCTRDEYAKRCEDKALVTFAFVKDGQWVGRGDMGWWAMVSNEKDDNIWNSEFNKMLDELPDSCWLSVIDCHI